MRLELLGFSIVLAALSFIQPARSDVLENPGLRGIYGNHEGIIESDRVLQDTRNCTNLTSLDSTVVPETVVSFYAMGMIPRYEYERYCLNHQLRQVDLKNADGHSFMIHLGGIKRGRDECSAAVYRDVANMFTNPGNVLQYDPKDCFFVPGDNSWQSCSNISLSWDRWIDTFGPDNANGFGTFSSGNIEVKRQTDVYRNNADGQPRDRSENFAFFVDNVLFIGLNLIGGGTIGDEHIRLNQNLNWTEEMMALHSQPPYTMKAAVLFGQADIEKRVRRVPFGTPFKQLLKGTYHNIPVMYLHGNTDYGFCITYPEADIQNFVNIEVNNGYDAPPILVSVVRNPVNGAFSFDLDDFGGLYANSQAGSCTEIQVDTWTPPPPMATPTAAPSLSPSTTPTAAPSLSPSVAKTAVPSSAPTATPSSAPTLAPMAAPTTKNVNPGTGEVEVELQISDAKDDYRENTSGYVASGRATHKLMTSKFERQAYRFQNVPIPKGATILKARLEMVAKGSRRVGREMTGIIQGHFVGNSPPFRSKRNQLLNCRKTKASVEFSNLPKWTVKEYNTIGDVAPIVQEIVNRWDYSEGSAIKLILSNNGSPDFRTVKTYESGAGAKLIVSYNL